MLLLTAIPLSGYAQVQETGSFRSFILGEEPAAAYDNWVSRVVEGLAEEGGYNDYIPEELDPQRVGFGEFEYIEEEDADSVRRIWRDLFEAIWLNRPMNAEMIIQQAGINYEVVYFNDTETGHTFRMLRECLDSTYVDTGFYAGPEDDVVGGFHHGWGLFVFNPEAALPQVQIQMVHPNDDYISVPIGVDLFLRADMGTMSINGAGREVAWSGGTYNNGRSISDPSRNANLPLQFFAEFFIDTVRAQGFQDLSFQVHSYDTESHLGHCPMQASPGTSDGFPNRPLRDLSSSALDIINFMPMVAVPQDHVVERQPEVLVNEYIAVWHGNNIFHRESGLQIPTNVDLPGYGDNHQMIYAYESRHSREAFDSFLHIEFDELPDAIEEAEVTELEFYQGTLPPTEDNWSLMYEFYETGISALVDFFHDLNENPDTTPPPDIENFTVNYISDDFVDLSWSTTDDPNFNGYEIYYDTTLVIGLESPIWSRAEDPMMVGMLTNRTRINNLIFNRDYGFRIRAVDLENNSSQLTEVTRATSVDTTLPEIVMGVPILSYPSGAWPAMIRAQIRSVEPLQEVRIESWYDGEQQLYMPLEPLQDFEENGWIDYEGLMEPVTGDMLPGTQVDYRVYVGEDSEVEHIVLSPSRGTYSFSTFSGDHLLDAPLQVSNGNLFTEDPEVWQWGTVETGPQQGYDGTNAWYALETLDGDYGELQFPQEYRLAGLPVAYLTFMHWYQTEPRGASPTRVRAGGIVQLSVDQGETWETIDPVQGYPKRMIDGPLTNEEVFGGNSMGWRREIFRLTDYVSEPDIMVKFCFSNEDPNGLSIGWVIDNIRLTSEAPAPEAVDNLRITQVGDLSVQIRWDGSGADYYRVYRSINPYGPMTFLGATTLSSFTDSDILSQSDCCGYYRIIAVLR